MPEAAGELSNQVRLLHIEDDSGIADVLRIALTRKGFDVVQAVSGTAGLDMLYEVLPHVVLLDINMPIMSGFNVLEALRAHSALRERPIICVTAMTLRSDVERAFALGCHGYVFKPVNLRVLTALINYYTDEGSQEEKLAALVAEEPFSLAAEAVRSGVDNMLKLEMLALLRRMGRRGTGADRISEIVLADREEVDRDLEGLLDSGLVEVEDGLFRLREGGETGETAARIALRARSEDVEVAFINLAYLDILD